MGYHVEWQDDVGLTLGYGIRRTADRYVYDFADSTFKNTTPTTKVASLPEDSTFPGTYGVTLASTPQATFPDGDYATLIVDMATGATISAMPNFMHDGDDSTVAASVASLDPRIEAFLIGKVTVDLTTGRETFYAKDDPTTPVYRADPDGAKGRIPNDLRGA